MPAEGPLVAVLAAGSARRFGGGKLDAECAGKRLGAWALEAVARAGLEPGAIVVAPVAPAFAQEASGWKLLTNGEAERGLGTSVAVAARWALAEARDLLLLLADMPLVEPAHLRSLCTAGGPAATAYGQAPGVPAFVPLALLAPLARRGVGGDEGGAGAYLARIDGLRMVAAPPGTLRDVDRPDELQAVAAALARRAA